MPRRKRADLEPATRAIVDALASRPLPTEDDAEDRIFAISQLWADEVMVRGLLPAPIELELYFLLTDALALFPVLADVFRSVSEGMPARPQAIESVGEPGPEKLHRAALRIGALASANDYLLAVAPPQGGSRAAGERVLVEEALGIVAAFVTGAVAAIDRLGPYDRAQALLEASDAYTVVHGHLASLTGVERKMFEDVSLHLHEHPRDAGMDLPSREVLAAHHASMKQFGRVLARIDKKRRLS